MRQTLPNRRGNLSFNFEHEGHGYHCTASRYDDGRLAEIFLDTGKTGTSVQEVASTAAILASLALQHGVPEQMIIHAVAGPLKTALELAVQA